MPVYPLTDRRIAQLARHPQLIAYAKIDHLRRVEDIQPSFILCVLAMFEIQFLHLENTEIL